jgi:hypothetical protein
MSWSLLISLTIYRDLRREFAASIGARLKDIAANHKPKAAAKTESKIVSMVSTATADSKKTMGPLKTSRAGEPSTQQGTNAGAGGSSRLLQSALQSSRGAIQNNQARGGGQFNREQDKGNGQKRNFHDNDNNGDNKRFRDQGGNMQGNRVQQSGRRDVMMQPPHANQAASAPAMGAPVNDTVQYFEQMNKVAQASGFRNAQEMLASQKEMMAMMHGGVPAGPVPMPMFAPAFPVQAPFTGGPPPPPGYPPQQFGYGGFQGRGGRGYQRGGAEGGRGWEGGRGRGRGRFAGRGDAADPSAAATSVAATAGGGSDAPADGSAPAASAEGATVAASSTEAPHIEGGFRGGYQGRGGRGAGRGYQGRAFDPNYTPGRFGRGGYGRGGGGRFFPGAAPTTSDATGDGTAPATVHKTWVRKPDLDTALVTGR